MIKKILKINNFAIFKDFKWQSDLPEFRKHNLLYGWNYSGKTTISRVFQCFEQGEKHVDFEPAEFELIDENNRKYTQEDNDLNRLSNVRVFNTDYINHNFRWHSIENSEITPIFMLGEKNIELEKDLEKKHGDQKLLNEQLAKYNNENDEIIKNIEIGLTNKARDIKKTLSIPDYNKDKLKPVVTEIIDNSKSFLLEDDEYNKYLTSYISTEHKPELLIQSLPSLTFAELYTKTEILCVRQVGITLIIKELKDNEKLSNWVREGKELHKSKDKCYFCGNKLPLGLLDKLNKHFSTEFKNLDNSIKSLLENINLHWQYVKDISFPDKAELYKVFSEVVPVCWTVWQLC